MRKEKVGRDFVTSVFVWARKRWALALLYPFDAMREAKLVSDRAQTCIRVWASKFFFPTWALCY